MDNASTPQRAVSARQFFLTVLANCFRSGSRAGVFGRRPGRRCRQQHLGGPRSEFSSWERPVGQAVSWWLKP